MSDHIFWSVVAQVSATFIGLVFVGLSIYLSSIRKAVSEIGAKWALKEMSSNVMFTSVFSGLVFFISPLIVSFSLVTQNSSNKLSLFLIPMGIFLFLFLVLVYAYGNRNTRQQTDLVLSKPAQRAKKLLYWRVKGGKWMLFSAVPVYVCLWSTIWIGQPLVPFAEDWLKST